MSLRSGTYRALTGELVEVTAVADGYVLRYTDGRIEFVGGEGR